MTLEEKQRLEAVMDGVITREIKRAVALQVAGHMTDAEVASLAASLGSIAACISTAHNVLSGEFTRGILEDFEKKGSGK